MGGKGSRGTPGNKSAKLLQQIQCPKAPDAETNSAILSFNKELFFLPDIQEYTGQAVADRTALYMDICERHGFKMQVNGYALALGMTRQNLADILAGKQATFRGAPIYPEALAIMGKFYAALAVSMEASILDTKGNPVGSIFLAKNHFGYQSEVIHTTQAPKTAPELGKPEDIAARYMVSAGRNAGELPQG